MSVVLTIVSLGSRVALAYALSAAPMFGVVGIWWSVPIGWFLADALGAIYYFVKLERSVGKQYGRVRRGDQPVTMEAGRLSGRRFRKRISALFAETFRLFGKCRADSGERICTNVWRNQL